MTIRVWPVDAVGGVPSNTGRSLRQTSVSPFVAMASTTRPLGVVSGVRPGTPVTTGSISGTTWSVGEHLGVVDLEAAAEAGGYAYSVDAAVTGTTAAADASSVRTDLVYGQLSDPAESDGSTVPSFQILYLQNPVVGTTLPATPVRSIPLMQVNVPKATTGNPSVSWIAPYTAAAGAPVPFLTLTQLQAWNSNVPPLQKAYVFNDSTPANNGDYAWIGGAWIFLGIATANITNFPSTSTPLTGPHTPRLRMSNGVVTVFGAVNSTNFLNLFTVPTAFQPPSTSTRFIGTSITSVGGVLGISLTNGLVKSEDTNGYGVGTKSAGIVSIAGLNWAMD